MPKQKYDPSQIEEKWPHSAKATRGKQKVIYNPGTIERKWRELWRREKVYTPDIDTAKKPYYNLMMFPYPSAEGMHVGNMYAFTGADIWGRYTRMQGFDVFEPIGLDGFGIHSENYAIKIGEHPREVSQRTQKRFYEQLEATGNAYDWTRTLETYDTDYYRWTQWLFIQMFKNGLAYRKKAEVNWCLSCKTVLADEQVIAGECERCGSKVEKRELEQWFFKITDYTERLLANLEKIDWAQKVKIAQKEWIGKKEGINIAYKVTDSNLELVCFTTTPVNWGATFIVIAPEHPLVERLTTKENSEAVEEYIKASKIKTKEERIAEGKEKTGVFTGSYATNHVNGQPIPVWVTDFVLMDVGTGAVQGCPGHDMRDFEFAKKYNIPIVRVVVGLDEDTSEITKPEQVVEKGTKGTMINSDILNGLPFAEAMQKTMDYFEEKGWGKRVTTYHLRDWLISRQRYWGPPIPMIFCSACEKENKGEREDMAGWYCVPEDQLPVELPYVENFKPTGTGEAPLAQDKEWMKVKCPGCGNEARRETDVSDTFLDSAWYFFRYTSTEDTTCPWNPERAKKWLPVHMYIGGAEHSVLHLMYSRFVTMALHDWGLISHFEEPFTRFYAHGMIIKDGAKMSKSKGNVVNPDEYIKKFGADTLRTYLMFLGPFDQGGDFRDTGIEGMQRFIKRVWELVTSNQESVISNPADAAALRHSEASQRREAVAGKQEDTEKILRMMHKTIKRVTDDMSKLRYNRAIAGIMEYVNLLRDFRTKDKIESVKWDEATKTLLLLLAPFAPFMTEELWQLVQSLGSIVHSKDKKTMNNEPQTINHSIHFQPWPKYDPKLVQDEEVVIPVQVNGKLRGTVKVSSDKQSLPLHGRDSDGEYIEQQARAIESVRSRLTGKEVKKVIFVPGKLINFVV